MDLNMHDMVVNMNTIYFYCWMYVIMVKNKAVLLLLLLSLLITTTAALLMNDKIFCNANVVV